MSLGEHLEKLRYFQRLVSYKSISKGAEAMGISQAGLSKSIANLESALDTQLFFRSQDGLLLTKEGELVLQTSRKIFSSAAELEVQLRALKSSKTPMKLGIGMYDSIAVYFFPELKAYIHKIYPNTELLLTVDTSSNLLTAINNNSIDLAIGVGFENQKKNGTEFFPLFKDYYSFFVCPQQLENIGDLPLIIHPRAGDHDGSSVETHLKSLIARQGVHHVYNFETLKTLASQGVGIGVLPTQVAKPLLLSGQLVNAPVMGSKQLFGHHHIGFIAQSKFVNEHRDFAEDIFRLGQRWSKS